uniref:E4 n=1 Tax=Human papillomavirus TaxID=10566 RepID=A0A2L0ARS2_9PAPI|nr:E4 [Human papillomavirus]CAD1814243.1 E4 [Human papillomavirus]
MLLAPHYEQWTRGLRDLLKPPVPEPVPVKGHHGERPQGIDGPQARAPRPPKVTPLPTVYEDEEEKENIDPHGPGGDQGLLPCLLRQWEKDIDWLINTILHDLQGYKRRLGIPQS